jgi:hypothetical protein
MADDFSAYGWGQGLSDMLGGYLSETEKIRAENDKKNQEQQQVEQVALQHLMTSDDPRVKAAAITAWLQPRKAGPGVLAKWYGAQEGHPAFQQVQTILGQGTPGMAPWLTPEQKTAAEYRGARTGQAEGIFNEYEKRTGGPPPQPFVENVLRAMSGAAQRAIALQPGVIGRRGADGKIVYENGFFDASTGEYYDSTYTPVYDGVDFRKTGIHDAGSQNIQWKQRTDGKYDVMNKTTGQVMATTDQPYVMPPAPAPGIIQPREGQPAQAVTGRGTGPFTAVDIAGTERPQETLRETYQRLNALKLNIEARAQKEDPNILGLDRIPYEAAVDHYAQVNGLENYAALIRRINEIDKQLTAGRKPPQQKPQSNLTPPPGGITPADATSQNEDLAQKPRALDAAGNVDLNVIRARVRALQGQGRGSEPPRQP